MAITKLDPQITIDGDAYKVSLPPLSALVFLQKYLKEHPHIRNQSWGRPCLSACRSEREESAYLFVALPGTDLVSTRYDEGFGSGLKHHWEHKHDDGSLWGFRPCLIPLDNDGRMRKLSTKENPNGSVVDGGMCLLDKEPISFKNNWYETITAQTRISFVDSQVGQRNMSWFVVNGLLISANILFVATLDMFIKKELLLSSSEEFLFHDSIIPHSQL